MDWWLLTFFLGAVLSLFLPIVPTIFSFFCFIFIAILFYRYKPLRTSSGLMLGAAWMFFNGLQYFSVWQDNNIDILTLAKQAQYIKGQVVSLQKRQFQTAKVAVSQRFNFLISHINNELLAQPFIVRLNWKNPTFIIGQGQILTLKAKFKPAHGLANLGGFSYQTWLKGKNIVATGYVQNQRLKKHDDEHNVYKVYHQVVDEKISIRQTLFSQLELLLERNMFNGQKLSEHNLSAILFALGFGDRSKLTPQLWQTLQATGTGHLIAISGLHIGLVASSSYFLMMLLLRMLPIHRIAHLIEKQNSRDSILLQTVCRKLNLSSLMQVNSRYLAILFSLLMAFSYGYLAGFSLPTIRAFIMLLIYWLARLSSVNLSLKRWLLLSLFTISLLSPFSLFSASFWLSFYAVIVIFLTLWRFNAVLHSGNKLMVIVKSLLFIQLSLTFMLLPIGAVFFQKVSFVALFANLIAVPWMSFITIPFCLLAVITMMFSDHLAIFFIEMTFLSLEIVWQWLTLLAQYPWAIISLSAVQVFLICLLGLIIGWFVFIADYNKNKCTHHKRKPLKVVLIAVTSLMIVFVPMINADNNKKSTNWQMTVLDVGQGLSVVITKNNHALLYDTGASYPSGFNMADAVVLPYLQYLGIPLFDRVILSHSDNDHAGGLAQLQQAKVIKNIQANFIPEYQSTLPENSNTILVDDSIRVNACIKGQAFQWQGLTVNTLWPETERGAENDDSCVIQISDGYHKVLLTGDISRKVEQQLLQKYPQLTTDVLIVPHHGSNTSSSENFLIALKPKLALVSAGFLNRWSMPTVKVRQRYQKQNIRLLTTATKGMISISFTPDDIEINSQRDDFWPFWFAN